MTVAAIKKYEPGPDGFFDLEPASSHERRSCDGIFVFTARDMAMVDALDRAVVADDVDYAGLFDYDDD